MTIVNPDLGKSLHIPKTGPVKEMLSVSVLPNGKRKVRINSSSLSLIQECMRKARYTLVEGWRAESESPATLFGSAIHRALEIFYSGDPAKRYIPKLEDLELIALGANYKAPDADDFILGSMRGFVEKAEPLRTLPEGDKRSLMSGAWILWNYFKTFKDDPYVAYVDKRGPFLERTFSLVIYEDLDIIIEVFGTIDFAFRHTKTGEILIGDHKSTSALAFGDSSYYDRERPNHQYTCYALGAREVFGIEAKNFLVSIIEVKAKPKTARGGPPSFPRQITSRTEEDFEEFREAMVFYVRLYLESLKSNIWPIGPVDACNKYGACQFKQVCAAPHTLRENILTSKFVRQ